MIGMRNVLVHGYFNIDTENVWNAAVRDLAQTGNRTLDGILTTSLFRLRVRARQNQNFLEVSVFSPGR